MKFLTIFVTKSVMVGVMCTPGSALIKAQSCEEGSNFFSNTNCSSNMHSKTYVAPFAACCSLTRVSWWPASPECKCGMGCSQS